VGIQITIAQGLLQRTGGLVLLFRWSDEKMIRSKLLLLIFLLTSCTLIPETDITQTPLPSLTTPPTSLPNIALPQTNFSVSGRMLVYTPNTIYLVNSGGSAPDSIYTSETPLSEMSLSPDGTKFAYFQDNFVYVKDLNTGRTDVWNREMIGSIGGQLKWSPDGTKLALSCSTPNKPESSICLVDENADIDFLITKEAVNKNTDPSYFIELQDWSRDGSKMFFTYYTPSEKGQKQDFSIYVYDMSSKTTDVLLDGKKQDLVFQVRELHISPDGRTLLISGIGENSLLQIFSLNTETAELLQLQLQQIPHADLSNPVWSNNNCCYSLLVERENLSPYTVIADLTGNILITLNVPGSVIQWIK